MREQILEVVKENGPILPVEIVSKTGGDSLVANAFLSDLVESGQLKKSEERIGSVNLYFIEGQEDQVKKRLTELDVNLTPRNFAKKPIVKTKSVEDKQKDFADRLSKIEAEEKQRKEQKQPKKSVIKFTKNLISRAKEEVIPNKPVVTPKPPIKKPEPIIESFESFFDQAVNYLNQGKLKIINENSEAKVCTIQAPSAVGPMRFHVRILEKKKINKTDIAESYTAAIEKKMPVIVITSGEIAKTAKSYLKEIGGLVRLKSLK